MSSETRSYRTSLHHTHLMAADIEVTLAFYRRWFGAELIADFEYAGARNIFVSVGAGRLHFYDQPPRTLERNAVNHLGFVVENLDALHDDMIASGVILPKGVHRFADGNYLMVEAPDRVLIELFEPKRDAISPRLQAWFEVGDVDPRLHPIAWPPRSPTLD